MKKEYFNAWLKNRVDSQARITIAACAGMAVLGLLVFVIQGGLLYLVFSTAYGSRFLGMMIVGLIFGGMGLVTWLGAAKPLMDAEHEVAAGFGNVKVGLAPTLSNAWTFAMGSMDSDQTVPQRILNLVMLSPRLLRTAVYVQGRIQRVKDIDVENCGRVLRLVLRKSERVDVAAVAEKFPDLDLAAVLRDLSLIDGVVFLTKDSVGITLANRFKDSLEAELANVQPSQAADASPFDG